MLLFLKSRDDIDPTAINNGLARANPAILIDTKAQPVLGTILGSFDLIQFYGLFLAAVGLKTMAKLSTGSAWAIVLGIWVVGLVLKVAMSMLMGQAF